ncbi:putative Ig domain-containing protein [Paenarthrobacter nitroguajacolicus]|uniref:putative Ig domain-containing protein n=1 Tax=Paenarthrobacter nitroguajacolicus TaxID=211146 RepID=UPI00248B2A03|nr:putative Ig domain-containing protein [Paenarthrobacter nitroguajacolicus]MDI2034871.1 hypothetical protein [Paenarthrobacter nitroguajacolicus]
MGASFGKRGIAVKAARVVLAGALASALALQFAPRGTANPEPPVPATSPVPTANATAPAVTANASVEATPPATEPAPTSTPTPAPTVEPTPSAGVAAAQPPAVEPLVTEPRATVEAADPLTVRRYVDRGYLTKAYDAPLVISGGAAPYTVTVSDVPPGLTFHPDTLRFTGMPTQQGYFRMPVTVTDSSEPAQFVEQEVAIDFFDYAIPLFDTVTDTDKFTDGVVGAWYQEGVWVRTAGAQPFTTAVVSGALPPGMSWGENAASGTPTVAGTYKFTLRATDLYESVDAEFTLTVRASAPQSTGFAVPVAVLGEPYSAKIASVTGGVAPYRFWWATPRHMAGSLWWHDPGPDGLTIDENGVLHGIPERVGSFQVSVYFSDSGLYNQGIFSTVVTVLATRPPAVEQPPAVVDPPVAVQAPAPQAVVLPAGALVSASDAELAATGLRTGSLQALIGTSAGLLIVGALLAAAVARQRRRRGGGG